MAKKIKIIGAKPKKIEVLDKPKRRIDSAELAAALGANPSALNGSGYEEAIALAKLVAFRARKE